MTVIEVWGGNLNLLYTHCGVECSLYPLFMSKLQLNTNWPIFVDMFLCGQ